MGIHAFDIRLRSAGVRRHQAAIPIEEEVEPWTYAWMAAPRW